MAYYRRRYRRYRPRRYIRRWFRRRFRRYVNGSSRSNVRLKCTVESNFTLPSGTSAGPGTVKRFCPLFDSSYDGSALSSPLYRTYCNLYEEVKVIGFKTQISIASVIGGSDIPSLQIYTAVDRRHGSTEPNYTAEQIKNSSTYLVSTALNNNVAKITRSCYASDLMEKAQWHDCSLQENAGVYADRAYTTAAYNPNFFIPALFMCFQSPTLGASVDVKVNMSTVFYFAFRNPKYGGGASASRVEDLGAVFQDRLGPDDDGDMDDGDGALLPDAPPDVDGAASASADEPARKSVLSKAPTSNTAARVVQIRRQQQQRNLRAEPLNV